MTEYWVSQGNKWCEFCKIFISNNPSSIRNHEMGQRHRDQVTERIANVRKENAAKEKDQKAAALALQQIEAKAKKSYQKDVASLKEASSARALDLDGDEEWEFDSKSGYYYNRDIGLHYDPNSGFYYSDSIGKWVTQKEAYTKIQESSGSNKKESSLRKPLSTPGLSSFLGTKGATTSAAPPRPVVVASGSLKPAKTFKGAAPSAVAVNKRKRQDEKPKPISKEEKAALKAREAAKKRVEEREKSLLGLYQK